jgi:hypothetical protein
MAFDEDGLSSILVKDRAEARGDEVGDMGCFGENDPSGIWENLNGERGGMI